MKIRASAPRRSSHRSHSCSRSPGLRSPGRSSPGRTSRTTTLTGWTSRTSRSARPTSRTGRCCRRTSRRERFPQVSRARPDRLGHPVARGAGRSRHQRCRRTQTVYAISAMDSDTEGRHRDLPRRQAGRRRRRLRLQPHLPRRGRDRRQLPGRKQRLAARRAGDRRLRADLAREELRDLRRIAA